jgi:hypothetical protein
MFKSLSSKEIYDNSALSFSFEFFTPLNKREAAAKISRALGKKVKWFTDLNESFEPTYESFKLAPTYSNGYKESTLSTGFMPYQEAIHMFLKIANVVESIGKTTTRCSVKTNIRLNERALSLPVGIDKLNRLKYLLGLNESRLFELWPPVKGERTILYQNQFNFIQPKNLYNTIITENFIERMNPVEFSFPESDFFATDFSEMGRGQIGIRYIGGKDYTKKKKESIESINLVIEHLAHVLSQNYQYSIEERRKISGIATGFNNSIEATKSYLGFKNKFPNIIFYVDLKQMDYLIEAHYPLIREKIFKLIVSGGVNECIINYDTNRKAIQIKDAEIKRSILIEDVEFYQCKVEADSKNCLFENCEIINSKLDECKIFSNNIISSSKLIDCDFLGEANEISLSYLKSSETKTINANLTECLVNRGKFSLNSTIDKLTTVINKI